MFKIIAHCDPYNARFHYRSGKIIKRDGTTPIAWVVEEHETREAARESLFKMALEDLYNNSPSLEYVDADYIDYLVKSLTEDYEMTEEAARALFTWYKGEGIYHNDSHEPEILKGGESYTDDAVTYTIE